MEVILLERIEKLGRMGAVVRVRPGYARNYLLPQGKAVRATDANRTRFEQQKTQLETQNIERRSEAEEIAAKLKGLYCVIIRQAGESGQLYGSVNARDVAQAVTEAGFTVSRQQVQLKQPIKTLGLHPVTIRLHPEVTVDVVANVARSIDESETQATTGVAVSRFDEEEAPAVAEPHPEDVFEEGVADETLKELEDDAEAEQTEGRKASPAARHDDGVKPSPNA